MHRKRGLLRGECSYLRRRHQDREHFRQARFRGNYEEIADYVYNRVGAVGIAWGAMSQKAAAIAMGFNRLGIPVIVGPHGTKYRRMLLGRADREEDWYT